MSEVKKETENDSTFQKLSQAIKTSIWSDPEIQPYTNVKDELSECDGILLRGTPRLVLPQSLEQQAIECHHAGQQGIVKTKRLLREKVWFPSIDRMVQERIKNCIPCQAATQANGVVERFMRTLEKAIRTAHLEKKNWKQEINVFLRQYRATPHSTTNTSPSEALNSRKLQTLLPQLTEVPNPEADNSIHETDSEKKRKMKAMKPAK
ncbi:Transposon Tf2-9 poly [Paramuricea clavata]|uniref:Transposon Tf2-9 poly n=1 Tax=Paramuricea clavata TaxID=317549 RepID=A0A7D9DXX3_PARCT|nr:Transposon Tf2-9 poly [Paramuricea clavata]